jgi:hypothetical protein
VLISLAYVSTVTYTVGQNVVGPDGVFYTALRTTIGDTPASSPSDWVGTSAAAAASASAALASQVAAAASASTATTQASNAATSAATATTQAGLASGSAIAAAASESAAAGSAAAASSSASAALVSQNAAAASFDMFDDIYLGAKASDPALDNDGNALASGALYFNTTISRMKVYTGVAWSETPNGSISVQTFSGTGAQTAYTLAAAPASENNTQVFIGGVYQQKSEYSISGTTMTFGAAPIAGTNNIEVVVVSTFPMGETSGDLVEFTPAGAGAVATSAQDKLREVVSVKDFGAIGDGTTDDADAIEAADTYSVLSRVPVFFPAGSYRVGRTITRKTQSAWFGAAKQSSYNINNETQIYGTVADIGDGNPMIRCAVDGVAAQSLVFQAIEFISNKSVNPVALDTTTASGVVLVDSSHVKNGLEFVGCSFKSAYIGVKQGNGSPYQDKTTFQACHFNLLYRAIEASPTAGLHLHDTFIYDCFDWIDSTTDVLLSGCSLNNSSFSGETCSVEGRSIVMLGGWTEGGNSVIRPTQFARAEGVYFSETYSASGSTKFVASPQNDGVAFEFSGCRVPTNTRLFNLAGRTLTTIWVRLFGLYNGVNFSDVADLYTQVEAGLNYHGFGNINSSSWNIQEGSTRNAKNATYTLVRTDAGKLIFHSSASTHTWTIPSNASVPYPLNTEIVLYNENGGGDVTVAITSDTLRWGSSTGSRTLAANGTATIRKVSSTTWRMTGEGIT